MEELSYEITEKIGQISQSTKGWVRELNLVKWNEREAKYDLRDWDSEHQKMGKGITLTNDEIKRLKELLNDIAV